MRKEEKEKKRNLISKNKWSQKSAKLHNAIHIKLAPLEIPNGLQINSDVE